MNTAYDLIREELDCAKRHLAERANKCPGGHAEAYWEGVVEGLTNALRIIHQIEVDA